MAGRPAQAPAAAPSGVRHRILEKLGPEKLKFSSDVFYVAASQVLGRGSLILASLVVANFMLPEHFALFAYFNLTVTMIAAFATLGLGLAASRIFAESTIELGEAKRRELRTVLCLTLACALVAVLLLHVLPNRLVHADFDLNRGLLYSAILAVTLNNVVAGALSGRGAFRTMALAAAASLCTLIAGVGTAVYVANIELAILAVLASMLVQVSIQAHAIRALLGRGNAESFLPRWRDVSRVLQIAGPMFATSLLVMSVFWLLGRFVLGGQNGVAEFSNYAIGLQWFSFILLVPAIITRVFFPRIVRAAKSETADKRRLVIANAGANFTIAGFIGCITLLFPDALLALYGAAGETARAAFPVFVLAAIVASPVNGLGNSIIARDPGPRRWLLLQVIWTLVALISVLYLFADRSAASSASALLLAYCCLVPASLFVLRRQKLL